MSTAMKIDFSEINIDSFMMHPHMIAGEICQLIQPNHIGAKWTKDNLHFRSLVVDKDGYIVSASFPKFFNWDEQPDLAYKPFSLTANGGCDLLEKIDGSTLIVSKWKGEKIYRTRGTTNAKMIDNGYEIDVILSKYPGVANLYDGIETGSVSYIFEWVSPTNRIVLNYGAEPDIYLIGAVDHSNYSLFTQSALDAVANQLGVKRPKRFNFNSIKEMLESIDQLKGQEGLCVYCNHGQTIRKVKSAWYLSLHRMKAELGSFERIVDVYFTLPGYMFTTYQEFYDFMANTFDYEIAEQSRGDISRIIDGMKEVMKIHLYMQDFILQLKDQTSNRKEQAIKINQAYGNTNKAKMMFKILDGKPLDKDDVKKLLYQVLKD